MNLKLEHHLNPDFYTRLGVFPGVTLPRFFSAILTVSAFYDDGFQEFSTWISSNRDCNISFDRKKLKIIHVTLTVYPTLYSQERRYYYSMRVDLLLLLNLAETLLRAH